MKDCFWCEGHENVRSVVTHHEEWVSLCRDCQAINRREMKGGA